VSSLKEQVAKAGSSAHTDREHDERVVLADGIVYVFLEISVAEVLVHQPERQEEVEEDRKNGHERDFRHQ
jgi:hypothetical protein